MDPRDYRWTRLDGLKALLKTVQEAKVRKRVKLEHSKVESVFKSNGWNQYCGLGLLYVHEAFLLDSGVIVASVSVDVFTGTFHSNTTVTVFFVLTPT